MQIALIALAATLLISMGLFQLAVTVLAEPPLTQTEFVILVSGVYSWVYWEMRGRSK